MVSDFVMNLSSLCRFTRHIPDVGSAAELPFSNKKIFKKFKNSVIYLKEAVLFLCLPDGVNVLQHHLNLTTPVIATITCIHTQLSGNSL